MNRSLHIGRGVGDAFAQIELQRELRVRLRALARDDVEPGNLEKLFFERRRDVVRHRRRIRAGIGASDVDDRIIDRGQIVDGKFSVCRNARDDDRKREQNRHDRPANERTGKTRAGDLNQFSARRVLRFRRLLAMPRNSRRIRFAVALPIIFALRVHPLARFPFGL